MTNFRLSLTLAVVVAGLMLPVQPAQSSDLDDMLKKYPNPAAGTFQADEVSRSESRMLTALNDHIQKMYSKIGSAATAGTLTADEAAQQTQRVQEIEQNIRYLRDQAKSKSMYDSPYALSTLFTYSDQLSYGDVSQLVYSVGAAEADLNDILVKKQKQASELAAKTPPPKAPPPLRPSAAKPYRNTNPATNSVY